MLILSKRNEKDYYDGVVGTVGIDKTIVYDRQIIEFKEKEIFNFIKKTLDITTSDDKNNPFYCLRYSNKIKKQYYKIYPFNSFFIIGFCGKLYVGWKFYGIDKTSNFYNSYNNVSTTITYDLDFIKELLEEKTYRSNLCDNLNFVSNYNALDLFRKLNAPCFVYDFDYDRTTIEINKRYYANMNYPRFIINPLLKNYEFYKVFDTFQTFQEISMFMGGVLGKREKEIVEISDKHKITEHGFDLKWSFRKESENKK